MVRSRSFHDPNSYGIISFEGTCRCGEDRHDKSPSSFGDPQFRRQIYRWPTCKASWHMASRRTFVESRIQQRSFLEPARDSSSYPRFWLCSAKLSSGLWLVRGRRPFDSELASLIPGIDRAFLAHTDCRKRSEEQTLVLEASQSLSNLVKISSGVEAPSLRSVCIDCYLFLCTTSFPEPTDFLAIFLSLQRWLSCRLDRCISNWNVSSQESTHHLRIH